MDVAESQASAGRLANYLDALSDVIGHAARVGPMRDYCTGLLLPCKRKSVEPMAAATAPARASAQHQALLHFVAEGAWSDEAVLAKVREMVLPQIERHGAISAWILDGEPEKADGWEPFARRTAFPSTASIRSA